MFEFCVFTVTFDDWKSNQSFSPVQVDVRAKSEEIPSRHSWDTAAYTRVGQGPDGGTDRQADKTVRYQINLA